MDFVIRPLEERDFPACVELLRGHLAYPESIFPELPKVWRRLFRDDALVAAVGESTGSDSSPVILGFAVSVFVTDEWMDAARTSEEPYLAVRTVCEELRAKSPVLRPRAIQACNDAGGLNILNLHYAEPRLPEEERMRFRYAFREAFIEYARGYRIKAFIQEFWDEMPLQFMVNGWGKVLTDYAAYFERRGTPPPFGQRPFLVGLTQQGFLEDPGDLGAPAFVYTPPRLGFTRAEQRMLRQAVLGRTDVELARLLGLALATIKTRWRSIYDRLGRVAPELISDIDSVRKPIARGQEKRRRVLEYLRRHPEELRPGLRRAR